MMHTCNPADPTKAQTARNIEKFTGNCILDARKHLLVAVVVFLCGFFLPVRGICGQTGNSLVILDAGVERSEDAPVVSQEYQFYPGDYLYFRFQIGGFAIHSDATKETRNISLAYEITPLDEKEVPLTPAVSGVVETELSAEDKNWTPKRRVSFLLPSFVAAGTFHVRVLVKDLLAKNETARDFPFHMGGAVIAPSASIAVENFHFFRSENDRDSIEVAAYRPGDTVYARFAMAGYQLGPGNRYHLAYGLTVLKPDGKTFVQEPNAAELTADSFYPAPFVPGDVDVITARDSPKGVYIVMLTVKDLNANRTFQLKSSFTLE
jgi:hypothetical protein